MTRIGFVGIGCAKRVPEARPVQPAPRPPAADRSSASPGLTTNPSVIISALPSVLASFAAFRFRP